MSPEERVKRITRLRAEITRLETEVSDDAVISALRKTSFACSYYRLSPSTGVRLLKLCKKSITYSHSTLQVGAPAEDAIRQIAAQIGG